MYSWHKFKIIINIEGRTMNFLQEAWNVLIIFFSGGDGSALGDALFASIIFLVFYISRSLISKILFGLLHTQISKFTSYNTKDLFENINAPLRTLNLVLGMYVISETVYPGLKGVGVLTPFTIVLFWIIYASLAPIGELLIKSNHRIQKSLFRWTLRVLQVVVVFIGASAVLEMWGIQVGAILAGLGILGAAVALGTQDLFKNLIAGFLILSERRFNEGEWICVTGCTEGTVEKIGLRSTLLRRFDQAPVHVPNSQLADMPLINFSRMRYRRIYWSIGLKYSATTQQLEAIVDGMKDLITGDDYVTPENASTFVVVDKFNSSSIDILLYCFTKTTQWGAWLTIKEQLAKDIKELVEENGTGFAFPSQSIYIEKAGDIMPPKL